jgi:hypothetical protein
LGGQAKSEKWRNPFLGEGLAVQCERNEHGKSQLSTTKLSNYSELSGCAKLSTLFSSRSHYRSRCPPFATNTQIIYPTSPNPQKTTKETSFAIICLSEF